MAVAAVEKKPKQNLKYLRDKDREQVKGIFRYYEVIGGSLSFYFRAYKEDPIERFDLVDGQIYTIPLGVAKHLNRNGWYPVYEYYKGEDVQNAMRIAKKVRRFGFQSLEFVDIDDLDQPAEISIVEKVPVSSDRIAI